MTIPSTVAFFEPSTPVDDRAVELAFALWERAGSPPGREADFLLAAERLLDVPPARTEPLQRLEAVATPGASGIVDSTI